MKESWQTRRFRWLVNVWPVYRRTGGRIKFIASDWSRIEVRLPLNLMTRNYVGTIYGGSMFGVVDPLYMVMLLKMLGPEYIVWDKAAAIRFLKPGRSTLYATAVISSEELAEVKSLCQGMHHIDRHYTFELKDKSGQVCAEVDKTLYVAHKASQRALKAENK